MLSRRKIMAACASLSRDARPSQRREWTAKAEEKAPVYQVDLSELVKAFPGQPGSVSLPPLLRRFGEWMSGKPWRSIGAFDLSVQWSDNHFPGGEIFTVRFRPFRPVHTAAGRFLGRLLACRPRSRARADRRARLRGRICDDRAQSGDIARAHRARRFRRKRRDGGFSLFGRGLWRRRRAGPA